MAGQALDPAGGHSLTILQVIKIRIFTEEHGLADIWPANCKIQIHTVTIFHSVKNSSQDKNIPESFPSYAITGVMLDNENIPILIIKKINESSGPNLYAPGP